MSKQSTLRRMTLILGLGTLLGLAHGAGEPAWAAHPPDGDRAGAPPPRRAGKPACVPVMLRQRMTEFDSNGNGQLEPEEHRAMREALRSEDLARYDADRDGRLSETEHQAMHAARKSALFDALDANRDGAIARAEATGSCTPLEHHFDDIDADKNGAVSRAELDSHRPPRHHRRGHRPGARPGRR